MLNSRDTALQTTRSLLLLIPLLPIPPNSPQRAQPALIEGLGNKVPKVVVGSADALLQAVRAFGARALPAPPVLKALPPLFESKDAKARELAKQIVAELARWLGAETVRGLLYDKLRDAQKDECDRLIAEAPPGRPAAERLTRREAAKQAARRAAAGASGGDGDGDGGGAAEAGGGDGAAAAAAEAEEPVRAVSVRSGGLGTGRCACACSSLRT